VGRLGHGVETICHGGDGLHHEDSVLSIEHVEDYVVLVYGQHTKLCLLLQVIGCETLGGCKGEICCVCFDLRICVVYM
jgi:hypothetical protein